ncbi:hypothetical protein [Paenibacillus glycanilyticus]|uniref:hypothetical protein n=1 Tax=Paenibacillus glycanilyticus TaxID=126569 RepID=UPI00190FDA62|nr:hypothetical protein [Paenibacillus glycanilyticus]
MMKQTKFTVLTLTLAAALTIPAIINADSAEVTQTESNLPIVTPVTPTESPNDFIVIVPLTNYSSTDTSAGSAFVVPGGFGYGKLHFHNVGKGAVTVTVQHVATGLEYVAVNIAPGAEYTWRSSTQYPKGMRSGDYNVQFHSSTAAVNVDFDGYASNSVT